MYRTINDFLEDWKYESEATLKVFKNLTQESLDQKVSPEGRSLRRLAWHIALGNADVLTHAGFKVENFNKFEAAPDKLEDIIKVYEKYSQLVKETIAKNWVDESLTEDLNVFGETWKKGKMLSILQVHQIHHRAQMTVLMRQAGLKVPGVYGPAREEWSAMGMPAQE